MQTASPAALSWLESVIKTQELSTATSHDFGQPRCFRSPRYDLSALPMGERPDRKQGPGNKSHKNLNICVSAARDVRWHSLSSARFELPCHTADLGKFRFTRLVFRSTIMLSTNEKIARFAAARGTLRRSPARTLKTPECVMHRPSRGSMNKPSRRPGLPRESMTGQPVEHAHPQSSCRGGTPGAAMRPALMPAFRQGAGMSSVWLNWCQIHCNQTDMRL